MKEEQNEKRKPMIKIIRMINQYHSIQNLDGTEAEKIWARSRLERWIYNESKKVSENFSNRISAFLNDRRLWEQERDRFT